MKQDGFTEELIIGKLREMDVLLGLQTLFEWYSFRKFNSLPIDDTSKTKEAKVIGK